MLTRAAMPIFLLALLGGCATSDQGRARLMAPEGVGAVYSAIDMQTNLVLTGAQHCSGDGCESSAAFRRRVADEGAMLARAAYIAFPELDRRVPRFEFVVPEKGQFGTLSNSGGTVMILGGLADLDLPDAALDFIIAREMGHVIARHHDENTAWSIATSIAVQLLFPMANVIRGAAAALQSSAVSMVGSRVIKAANRPDQVDEADAIAMTLLRQAGHDLTEIGHALDAFAPQLAAVGSDGWIGEFQKSKARIDQLDCGTPLTMLPDIALKPADKLAVATGTPTGDSTE